MSQKVDIHIYHECSGEHTHAYPQILVPLQETMKIRVGDAEYEVTPQELCFIPAGMVHQCNYQGKLLVLNLSEDMSEQQDAVLLSYPLIMSMRGQITQLVELIQAELKQNPESKSVRYLYSYLYSKLMENGFSPSLYLRCIRINRAKELLASTNFSVMEIAVMVGYSSNSTFTRAFHNITGMTPKAYRDCPCFKRIG